MEFERSHNLVVTPICENKLAEEPNKWQENKSCLFVIGCR